ncbi:MAG TPA: DUF4845 domain-containing protein [Steroidobacteraceae bacterium]|jgi:hypothetical protein
MRHSQRGITFIGWLVLLVPVAIVFYGLILLTPIYLNYMRVAKAVGQMASEAKSETINPQALRLSLEKRFDIEGIEHPQPQDVDIHREGEHWVAIVDYEDVAALFGNISLLVQFHKQVEVH